MGSQPGFSVTQIGIRIFLLPLPAQFGFVNKELSLTPDRVASVHLGTLVELLSKSALSGFQSLISQLLNKTFSQYLAHPDFLTIFYQHFFDQLRSLNLSQLSTAIGVMINSLESRQTFITSTVWDGESHLPLAVPRSLVWNYISMLSVVTLASTKLMFLFNPQPSWQFNLIPPGRTFNTKLILPTPLPKLIGLPGTTKLYSLISLPQSLPDAVTINDQPVAAYHVTTEHGLTVLGVLVDTPPATIAQLVVRWHQPLVAPSRFHYQLDIPNQPGQLPYPLSVTVTYPKWWFATTITTPALASAGRLQYNERLSHYLHFDVDFAQEY